MTIDGSILIGTRAARGSADIPCGQPRDRRGPATSLLRGDGEHVVQACALAEAAFPAFAALEPERRAKFLEAVADAIVAIGDDLIVTAMAETGLPRARLEE